MYSEVTSTITRLNKSHNLLSMAIIMAALLTPTITSAGVTSAALLPTGTTMVTAKPTVLHRLSEIEMASVNAQGIQIQASANSATLATGSDSALQVLQELGKTLKPHGHILEANIVLNDVVYDTSDTNTVVNKDGSFTLFLPKTIGHISIQDVRLYNSTGASFGSIDIRGIDLRGTTVTVRSY